MSHLHFDPIVLRGRLLRYAILDLLHAMDRPLSVGGIATCLAEQGFGVPPRAGKQISDALRWERRRGRVRRLGRDRYVSGVIPRSTLARARRALREVRRQPVLGVGADPPRA